MNLEEVRRHPFFVPVTGSFILHILFAVVAMFIVFREPSNVPHEDVLNFRVKSVDTNSPIIAYRRGTPGILSDTFVPGGPAPKAAQAPAPLRELSTPSSNSSGEMIPKKQNLDESLFGGGRDLDASLKRTEEKELKDVIPLKPKSTENSGVMKRLAVKYGSGSSRRVESLTATLPGLFSPGNSNVNVNPEEGMPGFTPTSGSFGNSDLDSGPAESKGDIMKYESLDEFLDIQISTYQDPADTQKYYRIKLAAKSNAQSFKVMPKEIFFAIDCSLSIHPERLEEFKKGITYCLSHFNSDDVFNIVAFKDKVHFMAPQSLPPTPENIKMAERFIGSLSSDEKTDVYLAFKRILNIPVSRKPSNVILLSDGRPTRGVVDSRELINSVTRTNQLVRPIFAFSGGAKVNRYLLDFIAYQNRGWSQFMQKTWDIRKGLADFYGKIRDPIFINLRYRLNGLEEAEVFPRSLPDFYRNAEFTLYGKYTEEDKFSMQLLGDVAGQTKELIFSKSLKEAPAGGAEIMKGYAFNKIYDRISKVTVQGSKPELLKEIEDLSRRYQITTPYSPELQKPD